MNSADIFFTGPLASDFHNREMGTGFLRTPEGAEVGCRFILEQKPSADITLRCLLDTVQSEAWRKRTPSKLWYSQHEGLKFDLTTDGDDRLENLQFHVGSGGINFNGHQRTLECSLSHVDLVRDRHHFPERPIEFIEFSIVNFKVFSGNAGVRFNNIWRWPDGVTALRFEGREFWLRAVKDSDAIIKDLKANAGIGITATITAPVHSLDEWEEVESRIDDLCTVFTLISGNRVSWISARGIDSWGYPFRTSWRHSVTNKYTTCDILNTFSTGQAAIQAMTPYYAPIFELMASRFGEAEKRWNIRAAINTWHETVISDHFIVQRGLLICACMEMIRTRYLRNGGRETILDTNLFESHRKDLTADLKSLLKQHFPSPEGSTAKQIKAHDRELSLMYGHVRSLNYFPFRQSLEEMARELDMMELAPNDATNKIEDRFPLGTIAAFAGDEARLKESIKCFVRIRDHLTHQGNYLTGVVKSDIDLGDDELDQYAFLQRFTAAYLCSALGWTQPLPSPLIFA